MDELNAIMLVIIGAPLLILAAATMVKLYLNRRQRQLEIEREDRELKREIRRSYPSVKVVSNGKKSSVTVRDGSRVSGLTLNGKKIGPIEAKPGETIRYEDNDDGNGLVQVMVLNQLLTEEPRHATEISDVSAPPETPSHDHGTTYHEPSYHSPSVHESSVHESSYHDSGSSYDSGSSHDSGSFDSGGFDGGGHHD